MNQPPALKAPNNGNIGFLVEATGLRLRTAHWPKAEASTGRGSVVLLQGRREFIEKYYETIADLQGRGFDVYTFDWRGQGLSDRPLAGSGGNRQKGHIDHFEDYLADLELFMACEALSAAPRPLYMLGHSMGGHIGLRFLHDHPGIFTKAVLSAPMIAIELGFLAGLSKALVTLMTAFGRGRHYALGQQDFSEKNRAREARLLSSDQGRLQVETLHYRENPDLELGGVTYGWLAAAFASIHTLNAPGYPEAIQTPALIIIGSRDRVVSQKAAAAFTARLPRGQHKLIIDARHELLMERNALRDPFWAAFDGFIEPSK